ncbi:hypothetical protein TrRE_jg24 [Triparma retinervis]|uniref:DUF1731 domain-containing protein n=1 Tax=Triparma retinervis TaxID=2557542 RepID=A0A9W7FWS8_9STRA|nr:hypothetical protein TrRE_jg24 [Triparma retinervis]
MIMPFKLGLGGKIGDGKQWFPWVSGEDVGRIVVDHIMGKGGKKGVYNVISPGRVTNEGFTKELGSAVGMPTPFPMPGFVAGKVFGEMGEEVLVGGVTCKPGKLEGEGYQWVHEDVGDALAWVMGK